MSGTPPRATFEAVADELFALHEDIRSVMIVDLDRSEVLYRKSRARWNLPDVVQGKSAGYVLLTAFGLHEFLEEYFGPLQSIVLEFLRGRIIRLKYGDHAVVLTTRKGAPPDIPAKAGAICRARWIDTQAGRKEGGGAA